MPKLRRWQFIVFINLAEGMPPGDECEGIREALTRNAYDVDDVGWIAQFPNDANSDPVS